MKTFKTMLVLAGVLALAMAFGSTAQANTITGNMWFVSSSVASNAIPSNVPGTPPDVTFEVNSPLNFSSGALYTVGEFLASGSAFNIAYATGSSSSSMADTLFNFTGDVSVTTGETFTVTHDDGVTLTIGGNTVIDAPGPTAAVTTTETYTGSTGNLPFQLVYGECCGSPAVLQVDLPFSNVPEPATVFLFGAGLLGIAWLARKFRKSLSD